MSSLVNCYCCRFCTELCVCFSFVLSPYVNAYTHGLGDISWPFCVQACLSASPTFAMSVVRCSWTGLPGRACWRSKCALPWKATTCLNAVRPNSVGTGLRLLVATVSGVVRVFCFACHSTLASYHRGHSVWTRIRLGVFHTPGYLPSSVFVLCELYSRESTLCFCENDLLFLLHLFCYHELALPFSWTGV
jgi:hypothetical protein